MILSARFLDQVSSANSYRWARGWEFTEGDGPLLYLQLVDASQDRADCGFKPPGRRYLPASGATLQCLVGNVDDAKKVSRFATQPFASDGSIWALQLMPQDPVRGSPQLFLTLTEGVVVRTGLLQGVIRAYPKQNLTSAEMVVPTIQDSF